MEFGHIYQAKPCDTGDNIYEFKTFRRLTMKKFTLAVVAFALAIFMAACGCQNRTNTNTDTTATTNTTQATTRPTTMPTTQPTIIDPTFETNIPDPDINTEMTDDTTETEGARSVH